VPVSNITSKLFPTPVVVETDLILEQQVKENFKYVFNLEDVEEKLDEYLRNESSSSLQSDRHVSSQDSTHLD
jgi:hypothetical protein